MLRGWQRYLSNSLVRIFCKGQYTFLGDSLIGECCNLVVRTRNSNLILNYTKFKIWDLKIKKKIINIELQFSRSTMGHHSKFSIASQFNTGVPVIIGANIIGYRAQNF